MYDKYLYGMYGERNIAAIKEFTDENEQRIRAHRATAHVVMNTNSHMVDEYITELKGYIKKLEAYIMEVEAELVKAGFDPDKMEGPA